MSLARSAISGLLTSIQLLYASGFLFMGATEEQMQLLHEAGITHVSYVLILFSIAFILYLCKHLQPILAHFLTRSQSSTSSCTSTPCTRGPSPPSATTPTFRNPTAGSRPLMTSAAES